MFWLVVSKINALQVKFRVEQGSTTRTKKQASFIIVMLENIHKTYMKTYTDVYNHTPADQRETSMCPPCSSSPLDRTKLGFVLLQKNKKNEKKQRLKTVCRAQIATVALAMNRRESFVLFSLVSFDVYFSRVVQNCCMLSLRILRANRTLVFVSSFCLLFSFSLIFR